MAEKKLWKLVVKRPIEDKEFELDIDDFITELQGYRKEYNGIELKVTMDAYQEHLYVYMRDAVRESVRDQKREKREREQLDKLKKKYEKDSD